MPWVTGWSDEAERRRRQRSWSAVLVTIALAGCSTITAADGVSTGSIERGPSSPTTTPRHRSDDIRRHERDDCDSSYHCLDHHHHDRVGHHRHGEHHDERHDDSVARSVGAGTAVHRRAEH